MWGLLVIAVPAVLYAIHVIYCLIADVKHPLVKKAKGIWFLGNFLDFSREKSYGTLLEYPKLYGPFTEFYIFTVHAILITDIKIAKEVLLHRPKKFSRPSIVNYSNHALQTETGLFNANGAIWSRIRKSTAPAFSNLNISHKLQKITLELFSSVDRMNTEHHRLKKTQSSPVIDMKYESFALTIRIITIIAFGLELENPLNTYFFSKEFKTDVERIFRFMRESLMFGLPQFLWKYSSKYQHEIEGTESNERFTKHCREMIDYKRELLSSSSSDGFIASSMIDSLLIHEKHLTEKSLSDEEIIANVKIFYLAGADTTAVTITWIVFYFCLYPEVLEKVRQEAKAILFGEDFVPFEENNKEKKLKISEKMNLELLKEMKYTLGVVKETLRLKSPVASLAHEPTAGEGPVELSNGIVIPEGVIAWINTDGIHRLPEIFENPLEFQPERWLLKGQGGGEGKSDEKKLQEMESCLSSFGGGPRICPGMNLAYNEAVLAAAFSAVHFDMSLGCAKEEVKRVTNLIATLTQMPVLLTPRSL
jgi:cytochrome P450